MLSTGGLLVRIQPEEPSFQSLTAIAILHNFADELYGSEPDGCARFSSRMHASLRTALNNPIANAGGTTAVTIPVGRKADGSNAIAPIKSTHRGKTADALRP